MPKKREDGAFPKGHEAASTEPQVVLYEYFQSRIGRQRRTSEATGILTSTLSGMAHGRLPIGMEAAVLIEVATEGAVSAKVLCPKRAEVLDKFVRLHAGEVEASA